MTTSFGIVHDKGERLHGGLLFKPEPSVLWVVGKIVNFSDMGWDYSVCSYKIIGINRAAIAQSKRAVFKDWVECSPRAVRVRNIFLLRKSFNSLHNPNAITRPQKLLLDILGEVSVDDHRAGAIGDIC